ncbi:MAG: MFS transporter [Kordiimonadaceae bacterium]|jgi:fucose permease|nr:MFS transporter [Kordiimonadaceae bacterium]MBT6036006.1 MFS transporter [Kordiimonadaceae bacterium]MBT6328570.1 MFS transporter [Kordiimonadaceae bacterium]
MSSEQYDRSKIFLICSMALFTIAISMSLGATVAADLKTNFLDPIDFTTSATMIGEILGIIFLGFSITLFVVSPFMDKIGMGRSITAAATLIIIGNAILVFAGDITSGASIYWALWVGMLLKGIAWGFVEAAINPATASLYPEDKTHRLNVLHAWWPAGLIVGGLSGIAINSIGLNWQIALSLIFIPAVAFLILNIGVKFPKTESADLDVSFGDMIKEIFRRPSFFIWFGAMFLTAASELAPGQWVDLALTHTVGMRGILLLVYVSGIMFVARHFAGTLAHKLSPVGLLWFSALLTSIGLYMLSVADSPVTGIIAATVWGAGVCFMWPTMLASAAERYPRGGAWAIGLIGSAGAMSTYIVLPLLGAAYDNAKLEAAGGADAFAAMAEGSAEHTGTLVYAAEQSFQTVALLPIVLLFVFGGVWYNDRKQAKLKAEGASPSE